MTAINLNMLYFVSCYMVVKSETVPDLILNIETRVLLRKNNNLYNIWNVMIEDSGPHWMEIFMFVPETDTSTSINRATPFYTAVNCGIANWMANMINSLVSLSPMFREPFFPENYGNAQGFDYLFQENFNNFKSDIQKYTKKFVVAINNLIETDWKASYYKNMSVLETLASLQISIDFLSLSQHEMTVSHI